VARAQIRKGIRVTQVIDRRGNLFARFNVIDAAVVVIAIVLVPLGYVAWRVFRQPPPMIKSITPSTISLDSPLRVRMTGEHFVPYLNAFVARSNEPYSVPHRVVDNIQATFLIETPTDVELQLPDLDPGTYDLYLYDEGREVARKAAAITLTPGERRRRVKPGEPLPDEAIAEFVVRFDVDNAIVPVVAAGAIDLNRPDRGERATTAAKILSVKKIATRPTAAGASTTAIEAVIRAGVTRYHGLWVYPELQRIRAGEEFWFGTPDYIINGRITQVASTRVVPE
jgi:hypothetical protein